MRRKRIIVLLYLIGFLAFSVIFCLVWQTGKDRSQQEFDILLTERVYDALESRFQGPIMVARTMAEDVLVQELLDAEAEQPLEVMEKKIAEWLEGIRRSGSYDTVFLISDSSMRYYTNTGIDKVVDPTSDSHDVWYDVFRSGNEPYVISVDVDEVHDKRWTMFVDMAMKDSEGSFRGVCGVGVAISGLQELIRAYEEEYGVRIQLVDADGLVVFDTNSYNIETVHHADHDLSITEDYVYVRHGVNGATVTKYVRDLDYFLVVQNNGNGYREKATGSGIFWGELIAFFIMAAGILLTLRGGTFLRSAERGEKQQIDPLTGLHNRNYFKDVYGERGIFNTTRYRAIAVFDIDFFKEVNDTLDGDDILIAVANSARKYLGDQGDIYRWGGDEFVALMQWSVDFAYEICREFCKDVEKDGRVTVSVGITEVRLSDTIKKNYYRAAQGCYLVKEMGGNGVKRE